MKKEGIYPLPNTKEYIILNFRNADIELTNNKINALTHNLDNDSFIAFTDGSYSNKKDRKHETDFIDMMRIRISGNFIEKFLIKNTNSYKIKKKYHVNKIIQLSKGVIRNESTFYVRTAFCQSY